MDNFIPAKNFLEDKDRTIKEELSQAKPLVIASTRQGIVLITENPTLSKKIAEIYDRIAFGAIGKYVKFEKLRKVVVSQAIITGANYAREDVRVENLIKRLGEILDEAYSASLYKSLPWSVEVALAEVNKSPEHDKILVVLFNGSIDYKNQPYAIVGQKDILKKKIDKLTRGKKFKDMDLVEAIDLIKKAILAARTSEENLEDEKGKKTKPDIEFEIAVLRRDKPGRKFERIVEQRRSS